MLSLLDSGKILSNNVSIRALATECNFSVPFSLRGLILKDCIVKVKEFNLCVVMIAWSPGKIPGWKPKFKHDTKWYSNFFLNWQNPYGVAYYWHKESKGKLNLEGKVLDLTLLEGNEESILTFKDGNPIIVKGKDGNPVKYNGKLVKIINRKKSTAIAKEIAKQNGEVLDSYDGIIAIVDAPAGYFIMDKGSDGSNGAAFRADTDNFAFYAHEVGHIIGNDLGFGHSFGIETEISGSDYCTGMYGDPYCIMSAESFGKKDVEFNPTSAFTLSTEEMNRGPGLNGGTKDFLGWCGRIDFDINQNVESEFEIQSLGSNRPDSKVIHIKDHERVYTVEYRSSLDENDKGIANLGYDGVVVVNAVTGGWAARTSPGKPGSATYLGEIPLKTKDVNLPDTIINFNAHWGVKIVKWNYEKNRAAIAIVKNNVLSLRVYRRTHDIGALNDGRPFCIERKGIRYWKVDGGPIKNLRSLI